MDNWNDFPDLTGEHVRLVRLSREHLERIAAAFAGMDVFTTFVPQAESISSWFDELERETAANRARAFTVFNSSNEICGVTRYMRMTAAHRRLEIGGTVYAPSAQRTGINTEAKLLLLRHAFEVLNCQVVQLRTDWLNFRSRAAIERLGAKLDGVLRGHRIMPDGHIRDSVVYSIISSEWPGVHANLRQLLRPKEL